MSDRQILVAGEAGIRIDSVADIQDALGAGFGSAGLLLTEADLAPEFFDLRSGLLGELMQKFVNYRMPLALVLPDPAAHGARVVELAREHRSHGLVRFVPTEAAARAWLEGVSGNSG
jgi:hypothetical protein